MTTIQKEEAPLNDDLKRLGVTRFVKENNTCIITFGNDRVVIFDIDPKGGFKTIENLKTAAREEKVDTVTISKVGFVLMNEQNDYLKFLLKDNGNAYDDNDDNGDSNSIQQKCVIDASGKELDQYVLDKDYSEYVIRTIKKTVKQEDVLVRQILYTALSSASDNPINLGIIAPTSEGKTYPVMRTLQYFPQQKVWNVGQMSTKALVRQKGMLIDNKGRFIGKQVKEHRKEIANLGNNKEDRPTKAELKQELSELLENSKTLIDLSGMILLFFEPPNNELWDLLKPILSHDKLEIEYPYVDKTQNEGLITKKVVVRGWPACIFCSAKDESDWSGWQEILSRFIITSPNMNKTKYLESNMLIAQTQSLPDFVQEKVIVSANDEEIVKKCVRYLLDKISSFFNNGTSQQQDSVSKNEGKAQQPIWIPFGDILGEALKSEKGTDNRIAKRLFAFIRIICLTKSHLRQKLLHNQIEESVVASLEDLAEALYITQNVSGIPPYKLKFYKQTFLPLYRSKQDVDKSSDENKQETIKGVTTKQLSDFIKLQTGKEKNQDNIRKNFLDEIENHDYVGSVQSIIDKRQNIYYPIIELDNDDEEENDGEEIKKLWNTNIFHNVLQHQRIVLPKNCIGIPENWLIFEILGLAKYGIDLDNFKGCIADELNYNNKNLQFLDRDGKRLTVKQFIAEYEKYTSLIPYFKRPKFNTFYNKSFGYIIYLGEKWQQEYEKLLNQDIFHKFHSFDIEYNNEKHQGEGKSSIVSVDEFFDTDVDNDPFIPYQPLPPHSLEQSPCYPILIVKEEWEEYQKDNNTIIKQKQQYYLCKLHNQEKGYEYTTDLNIIEYHCKTKDPQLHKAEILRLLKDEAADNDNNKQQSEEVEEEVSAAALTNNNILYSQVILRNSLSNQHYMMYVHS